MKPTLCANFMLIFILVSFSAESINLYRSDYYPNDDNDYFFRPIVDMVIVNDTLFGVENWSHKVLMFSIKDDIALLKQIGGAGQAPGELRLPYRVSVWNDEMLIKDDANFSFFDINGIFRHRFAPHAYGAGSLCLFSHNKIYMVNLEIDSGHLIDVYTTDGEKISEFGKKYLDVDTSKYQGFRPFGIGRAVYEGVLLSVDDNIIYLNFKLGDIIKFKSSGEEVSKSNICDYFGKHGKKVFKTNRKIFIDEGVKLNRTDNFIPANKVIEDAYLSSGKIYMLESEFTPGEKKRKTKIRIIAVGTDSFNVVEEYVFSKMEENRIISFTVAHSHNKPIFYISMETDDFIVAKFESK